MISFLCFVDGDPHSIFIFIFYKNMKKSFLFKWVAVLGAISLLTTSALPWLSYANSEGDEACILENCWDLWTIIGQSNGGDVIILQKDVELDDNTTFLIDKKITINWNWKKISTSQDAEWGSALFSFAAWSEWSVLTGLTIEAWPAWSQQAMVDFLNGFWASDDETVIDNVNFIWAESCDKDSIKNHLPIQAQNGVQWKISIKNSTFTNVKYAMYFNSLKNLTIEGNTIDCTKYNAIHLAKIDNDDTVSVKNNTLWNIWQTEYSIMYNAWITLNDDDKVASLEWNTIEMNLDYPETWYYGQNTIITFDSDGWTEIEKQYLKNGDTIDEPENMTKEWFALDWWYNWNNKWDFSSDTVANEDITLKAKWLSTVWTLTALPAADGSYTATISDDGKTITYTNISEKDPGAAGNDETWNWDRPAWYIWFGSRYTHPESLTGWATFGGETVSDEDKAKGYNDIWAWISATKVKELVEAWTLTKSREVPASYDGTASETFNIVVDLNNIEVKDTDENDNTTLIKVVNWKITVLSWEEIKQESSNKSSWWGGGSSRTTKADDTKATTWDTAKVDENNTEENKDENANEEENKGEEKSPMTDAQAVEKFGQEQIDAYKWALGNGITTMKTVGAARLDEPLTRAELAKMMVVYIQKVLEKDPILTGDVNYSDVGEELGDLFGYIKLAYQYQIMWINADGTPIELFNPYGLVTRWEYATVFSRVLFGDKFNKTGEDFYTKHLEALKAAWILTNTIPTIQEMRGWVMLMMYRSSQNAEKIENVANTTETNEERKADEETTTPSDETKSEANEEEKAEEATNTEATTWDVAETPTAEASAWDTASN